MISLSVYGYKKFKKHQEKKKIDEGTGEVPPVIDQSSEFLQSPTSSVASGIPKGGAMHYANSNDSGHSGTASDPSEYEPYQQYLERQSHSYVQGVPDQPPTYQAALSPPPQQTHGQWVFVPAGGPVTFANGPPAILPPPSPLPGSPLSPGPLPPSSPLANELPASLPVAAYTVPTAKELPAHVPVSIGRSTAPVKQWEASRFELPASDTVSPSRLSQQAEGYAEAKRSEEMKRYELE